jgi:RND family efflux transporter MFP subunit
LTILLGLVAVIAAVGARWLGGNETGAQEVPESAVAVVRRGDLEITVTENGYLKAKNSDEIKPKFRGGSEVTWLIDEGEEVVEGDILAEFDKTEIERRISDLENQMIQYEAELEAARSALAIQERDGSASIEKAQLAVELKRMDLERYQKGDLPNERRKKVLASEKAVSELERAIDRFEQVPELEREGFLTKIQVEEERIKLREAEIGKENAERDLELYETYTTAMELRQKESDLRDAERELENSREKRTISLKEKQARVTQQERQINQTHERLEHEREELANHTVLSPGAGVVYYGDPERRWMRDQIKVGNSLSSGHTMFTLPDLTDMQVLIQVHEGDIDQVEEGMAVIVTVETHKGRSFTGKVTEIATVATSQSWTDEANKTFRVEVTMDKAEIELRAGVTAKVEIQVEELADVLQIPIHAVFPEDGQHWCFLITSGKVERRKVEVGKNNAHFVEVTKGLSEGERVLLYDPRVAGEVGAAPGGSGRADDADPVDADDGGLGGMSSGLSGMGAP